MRSSWSPAVAAMALLSLLAAVLAALHWPRPPHHPSAFQLTGVPAALWALVARLALVCLAVSVFVAAPAAGLRPVGPLAGAWLVVVVLGAGALVLNALYFAGAASPGPQAIIPVFHWLFTFAPALLAAALLAGRSPAARRAAALGTGVVTVPLLALSWALLWSGASVPSVAAKALYGAVIFGVLPLAGAVALAGPMGRAVPAAGPPRA